MWVADTPVAYAYLFDEQHITQEEDKRFILGFVPRISVDETLEDMKKAQASDVYLLDDQFV